MCIFCPTLGLWKWLEKVVIGCPVALLANNLRKTPKCSTLGIIFSKPILAMCTSAKCTPMSALPSFVQTTNPPVSAMAKLTPVKATLRVKNVSLRC